MPGRRSEFVCCRTLTAPGCSAVQVHVLQIVVAAKAAAMELTQVWGSSFNLAGKQAQKPDPCMQGCAPVCGLQDLLCINPLHAAASRHGVRLHQHSADASRCPCTVHVSTPNDARKDAFQTHKACVSVYRAGVLLVFVGCHLLW
jgi:hypothetical protein